MFKLSKISILIILFLFGGFAICFGQVIGDKKIEFEAELVKALNLQFVNRDSDYSYSSKLRFFGDTVVGFYARLKDNQDYRSYYIQSLKNPSYKVKFDNPALIFPTISEIDFYKNGCLYFGKYQGTSMQKLCSDGTLTNYFYTDQDTDLRKRIGLHRVMIYKDQVVLSNNYGIYIYNIAAQKLIWKYAFENYDGSLFRSIFGNKLIISVNNKGLVNVVCYDLDKHELIWTKKIVGNNLNISPFSKYGPSKPSPYPLSNDNNNVVLPGRDTCYLIDINSGTVSDTVPWKAFSQSAKISNFKIENDKLYITDLNDDQVGLLCLDMKTNKIIWNVKEVSLYGFYKNYVVGFNPKGTGNYLIIDKNTGIVKDNIANPNRFQPGFYFLDNYVLIGRYAIYK